MPAVIASLSFGALAIRAAVRYAGQKGWEMTMSESGSSRSNVHPSPSLSEVTMNFVSQRFEVGDAAPARPRPIREARRE